MEEFFLKLGLMTQRNHAELIQEIKALRTGIDALTAEISALVEMSTSNHAELKNSLDIITNKLYVFSDAETANHLAIKNSFDVMTKKITALANISNSNYF